MQNIQALTWEEAEVNARLERMMTRAYRSVVERMRSGPIPMRTAAFALAIERVAETETLRGGF